MRELIDALYEGADLDKRDFEALLSGYDDEYLSYARDLADRVRDEVYGHDIFLRGLIEFTNYCRRDCLYCGIRRSNKKAVRYRLTREEILSCCDEGYSLGFRTFVLQGGEDMHYTDDDICRIVADIKQAHPDTAVTLSIGERSRESYAAYRRAGADRYLLRHETADDEHYKRLHPEGMSPVNRKRCLHDLKELGYQVGCGFMVGSPFQTPQQLAADFVFIKSLEPHMVGVGPFIPHKDTPFAAYSAGSVRETLFCIALLRLMLPQLLIPATTALGTMAPDGREQGVLSGANVLMPNLSPVSVRKKYMLYDNKICTGEESAQCVGCLERRLEKTGYRTVVSRGDHIGKLS